MKNWLLVFFFLLFTVRGFSQQFSQYNTGTLYDSFENPSQKVFIADTSKMYAFNFLFPNFNTNAFLTGNVQSAAKTRLFSSYYNTAALQVGNGKNNHLNVNANAYSVMFKVFSSFDGDQELGFSLNTKAEGRGLLSDETVAIFNGPGSFSGNNYPNIFNDNFYYQVYQQIGFTYREQVTSKFALGIKVSALSGVDYNKVQINSSRLIFDKPNDAATLELQGKSYESGNEGKSFAQNLLPTFKNPGASVSLGSTYKTPDGFTLQANIKDLGFIHWNKTSDIYNFNNFGSPVTINGLSTPHREDSIYNKANFIVTKTAKLATDFSTSTNGLLELSASKTYILSGNELTKFSPTLIASKELMFTGFTAALVAPVQLGKYVMTLTSSYNDLKLFTLGGQFMIKTANSEFFIGSDKLYQTASLIYSGLKSSTAQVQTFSTPTAFTGGDFFIGFSMKFGPIIERDMNSSSMHRGEKGFLGKLFERIFPKDEIRNN
jgi:hypothetical protein